MTPMRMITRRVAWLLLIALVGGAVIAWMRGRSAPQLGAPPEWPPLEPPTVGGPTDAGAADPAPSSTAEPGAPVEPMTKPDGVLVATDVARAGWVEAPADGAVPEGFPIKVNTKSGVFHVPNGRFYDRTKAQRFYAAAEAAVADGYRQSKS